MAATTVNKGFPYPEGSDEPNVPADIQALAEAVDLEITGLGLGELSNVVITSPANLDSLKWDSATSKWINVAAPVDEDITTLSALEDVAITNLQANEVLVWDNNESKWVNTSISAAVPVTLDDLTDVTVSSTPENGQVLQFSGNQWIPATVSGTSSNSFTTVVGGSTNIYAASSTDTLSFTGSSGVTVSGNAESKVITISGTAYTAGTGLTLTGTEFSLTDSYQPLDADLTAIAALSGTAGLLKKTASNTWELDTNTYLTSYTETDPVFVAHAAYGITSTNITNWNTAYGWGNPAVQTLNPKTGSYELVESDLGKIVTITAGSSTTITVPALSGLSNGSRIDIVQLGTGNVTVQGAGVTVVSNGNKFMLNGQYAAATLIKTSSTAWLLVGNTKAA